MHSCGPELFCMCVLTDAQGDKASPVLWLSQSELVTQADGAVYWLPVGHILSRMHISGARLCLYIVPPADSFNTAVTLLP